MTMAVWPLVQDPCFLSAKILGIPDAPAGCTCPGFHTWVMGFGYVEDKVINYFTSTQCARKRVSHLIRVAFYPPWILAIASDHTLYIWRVKAEIQCTLQLLFKITSSPVSYRRLPRRSCYILPREMQNCAQTHFRDKTQKVKSCR